jgi:hypothetical protein
VRTAFSDFTGVASLFNPKPSTDLVLVAALNSVIKPPLAAMAISLGYKNLKITQEVLQDLEKNYLLTSPNPYTLIFFQLISLYLQTQEYLDTNR